MSGTTITARVRPGTAIAAELAALRNQLEASLELRAQEVVSVRSLDLQRAASTDTRVVRGRRVVGAHTPTSAVTPTSPAARVIAQEHATAVEQLRVHDERVVTERARVLVFQRMLERLPAGTVVKSTENGGGDLRAQIAVADGGEVCLSVNEEGRANLFMDHADVPDLEGADGMVVACDAEAELGRRFHEAWRENGLEVEADDVVSGDEGQQAMGAS